jgi:predicted GNAT superfamily acetyltransferase
MLSQRKPLGSLVPPCRAGQLRSRVTAYNHKSIAPFGLQKGVLQWRNACEKSCGLIIGKIQELGLVSLEAALSLNNAHAKETSLLDDASLAALVGIAFYARCLGGGASALLIALDQDALYDNFNFRWFKQRFDRFVYIDRVIVADGVRGQGLARMLYQDLFAAAKEAGHNRVVCEVNLSPPNPASDAFHAAMGFTAVGQSILYGGKKEVRYFEKILA